MFGSNRSAEFHVGVVCTLQMFTMMLLYRVLRYILMSIFCAALGFLVPAFVAQWILKTPSYEDLLFVWFFSVPGSALLGIWWTGHSLKRRPPS